MKYKEQLQQPEWFEKRELIKLRDLNKCVKCSSRIKLQVHHTYYKKGLMAWEYPDDSLITLCSKCHENCHELGELKKYDKTRLNLNIEDYKKVEAETELLKLLIYVTSNYRWLFKIDKYNPLRLIFKQNTRDSFDFELQGLVEKEYLKLKQCNLP